MLEKNVNASQDLKGKKSLGQKKKKTRNYRRLWFDKKQTLLLINVVYLGLLILLEDKPSFTQIDQFLSVLFYSTVFCSILIYSNCCTAVV